MSSRIRLCLVAVSVLALGVAFVTLERAADSSADSQLYASIARSQQIYGTGVPSALRHSPFATDHVRFYGPVYFALAARSFDVFGFSRWSLRLVSLTGALLVVVAGALLARALTGSWDRSLWAITLLMLAPEVTGEAPEGAMHLVAVGLQIMALAVFVRGLAGRSQAIAHGVLAGTLLSASMLTTPRTYPFIAAFFCAGGLLAFNGLRCRQMLQQCAAAIAVLAAVGITWAISSHGSVMKWLEYMAFIASHENTDVALLPTAVRDWVFNWSGLITPAFALTGAIIAAWSQHKVGNEDSNHALVIRFVLLSGWMTCVATVCVLNYTLAFNTYSTLPLFAIVIALPSRCFDAFLPRTWRRVLTVALAMLLVGDGVVTVRRYLPVAATWAARDPVRVVEWLRARIRPGADVVGPVDRYLFITEEAGGRYSWTSPQSWADWARWVPAIDPGAVGALPRIRPVVARYLIWPSNEPLPPTYTCAASHLIDVYTPPPSSTPSELAGAAWLMSGPFGYPQTALYFLPRDCPVGYDPTGGRAAD